MEFQALSILYRRRDLHRCNAYAVKVRDVCGSAHWYRVEMFEVWLQSGV